MYRNIPILSFIIQLGKCFNCKKRISIQYPLVEFITGFLWFWFIYTIPQEPNIEIIIKTIFSIIMVSYLIPLAIIDSKHLYFPFTLIIPLIILSISSLILNYFFSFEWFESLMGLTFAVTFLGTVYFIAKVWLKFKGREEDPMGFGDILLIIPLGIWLGPLNILLCFLISSILALLTWIILHFLINYEFKAKMPFGPYLIISSIIIKFLNLNII
jgi:prepilin signal peptidase PulO-like enzyme (type II secretory pathway)